MRNPFLIGRPAQVAFSGGRTSGMMLRGILDAYGSTLPDDIKVIFCNTGKEDERTLDFVHEVHIRWAVPILWAEYRRLPGPAVRWKGRQPVIACHGFELVTYETASRDGRPFEELIGTLAAYRKDGKGKPPILPNPPQRVCSSELKARTARRVMLSLGLDDYEVAIGIRGDEPSRMNRTDTVAGEERVYPLRGKTLADVLGFWAAQPFDLAIPHDPVDGTYLGNCDMCFLKRVGRIKRIAAERPEAVGWWARMEELTGARFRNDRFSYTDLKAGRVPLALSPAEERDNDLPACHCTD